MGFISAQTSPQINEYDLVGIEKITTTIFPAEGLWGYINGGADLYLEYGFEELLSHRIIIDESVFVADIYRMASPRAAYGIFSVLKYKCLKYNFLHKHDCFTAYQYLAAKGQYLVSVVNPTGSEKHQQITLDIARLFVRKISDHEQFIPVSFLATELQEFLPHLIFVNGPIGLQNGYPAWCRFFDGSEGFNAWIFPLKNEDGTGVITKVEFNDDSEYQQFILRNKLELPGTDTVSSYSYNCLSLLKAHLNLLWLVQGIVDARLKQVLTE